MYNMRQQVHTTAMQQQQPTMFNPSYQQSAQVMMPTQIANSWANANPVLSMETVTINPSGSSSSRQQQQPGHGPGYGRRMEHESSPLPQLSMRDLQCLEAAPPGLMNPPDPQNLFHQQQQQREELPSGQNQGLQTMWSNFSSHGAVQTRFNGPVPGGGGGGGGGGSQGLGSFPFLEGMEGDDFLKNLVAGTTQPGFQLKQEPQVEAGAAVMQSPRERQGNTYTNLLPRPMSNGTKMDPRRHDSSVISQAFGAPNPYANNGASSEGHFASLADWVKTSRQND